MTSALINIMSSALSIWDSKEKNKYNDAFLNLTGELDRALRQEIVDNGIIDDIENKLENLARVLSTQISASKK
jgi:hypothetical protein